MEVGRIDLAPNEPGPCPDPSSRQRHDHPPPGQANHGFPGSHGPAEQMPSSWLKIRYQSATWPRLGLRHRTGPPKRARRTNPRAWQHTASHPGDPISRAERTRAPTGLRSSRATRARSHLTGRSPSECRTNPRPGGRPHCRPQRSRPTSPVRNAAVDHDPDSRPTLAQLPAVSSGITCSSSAAVRILARHRKRGHISQWSRKVA
jgi:hypothetical protein